MRGVRSSNCDRNRDRNHDRGRLRAATATATRERAAPYTPELRPSHPPQMLENMRVFDDANALSAAEMAALGSLPQKKIFNVYCQPTC